MIRVTVEIWPRGDRTRAIEVARMHIANVSNLAPVSQYEIWASSEASALSGRPAFEASGKVISHRRKESIWALLARATAWVAASAEK